MSSDKNWWSNLRLSVRVAILTILGLFMAVNLTSVTMWNTQRMQSAENALAISTAETEARVAELKAKTASFKKAASVKSVVEVVYAKSFACATQAVMEQNFAADPQVQEVEQGKVLHFGLGCAWSKFDYKVTSLEGNNYLIAFDRSDGYEMCGKISPNNDSSSSCIALINRYAGQKFRVIMGPSGYLNIGGKNE